ncbi:MAG: D-alanyl-D-alanine carboxypeptidase family protein [Lachnospiraceae bacterium]
MRRKIGSLFLCLCLVTGMVLQVWGRVWEDCDVYAAEGDDTVETAGSSDTQMLNISAPSAILMEASTGQIIYEKDPDVELSPASITKIMTLLLIFDAIGSGKISLEDEVTVSAYAQSMGGSQVYLAEGEVQTVETLIKCIVIASGNDASVAMAEYIAGSEEAFVQQMNERAAGLGMVHTHFEDCCGLTNSDGHYTSARDVAIMSRELITKYPKIFDYSMIWMEDITHVTRQGTSTFTLTSTNKLLKQYQWTTGLKTGSTKKAKYCYSGTACKDGISLIAVVMAAPDYRVRFEDAQKMLQYGYSVSALYEDTNEETLMPVAVRGGVADEVPIAYEGGFSYLDLSGADLSNIHKEIVLEEAQAPILAGQKAGEAVYYLNDKAIGSVDLYYTDTVRKAVYKDYLVRLLEKYLL